MVSELLIAAAIGAALGLLRAGLEALMDRWHYRGRTLPQDSRAQLSETDREHIAATRELIGDVFGADPVERLKNVSNKERIRLVDEFATRLSELYGLDIDVDVTVDQVTNCGAYSWSDKKAVFNIALLMVDGNNEHFDYCVWETLDTVVHELRHAVQHRSIVEPGFWNIDQDRRLAWADNVRPGSYISSSTDMRAYTQQPVERDAFTFAAEVIEGVKGK